MACWRQCVGLAVWVLRELYRVICGRLRYGACALDRALARTTGSLMVAYCVNRSTCAAHCLFRRQTVPCITQISTFGRLCFLGAACRVGHHSYSGGRLSATLPQT